MERFYAHSKEGCPSEEWQPLEEHLKNVAEMAEKCAAKFHSADWAWNAAWLHDLGKAADEFQAHLLRKNGLDDAEYDEIGHGKVNHSNAGTAFAEEMLGPIMGRTNAYLAAGHHAGLPDFYPSENGTAALQIRLAGGENLCFCAGGMVAPRAGAWIETCLAISFSDSQTGRPSR
jgi:CRISPR-associated endonuclease/helicase Cas3